MDSNIEKIDIIQVSTEDYEAIYINGKQIHADHSIYSYEILERLKGKYINSFEKYWIDEHTLEEKYNWDFPYEFKDWNIDDLK